jgi:cytochrome c oxidase cbb3-type subunit 3
MCAKPLKKEPRQVETTGHSWDGIEEYNNPLPRWWVWVFYATIVWGIGYTVAYPAWPLITGATPGLLGASTRADVEVEIAAVDKANAAIKDKLVAADLTAIGADPELAGYAERAGAAVFRTNCAQCHGSGAAGFEGKGYPNLLDDDWLWGGTMEDIHLTVTHGIRNTTDADARYSEMPKFGTDGILDETQIAQVAEHVLAISGQEHDATLGGRGGHGLRRQLRRLPHGRRFGRPGAGRAEADRCDLALRWLARGDHRDGDEGPLRRHAELEPAPVRGRDPRRGLLCPQPWWW